MRSCERRGKWAWSGGVAVVVAGVEREEVGAEREEVWVEVVVV